MTEFLGGLIDAVAMAVLFAVPAVVFLVLVAQWGMP